MKPVRAFFVAACCGVTSPAVPAQGLVFSEPPQARRFADGAIEWTASVSCADPTLLLGARVAFTRDENLDGAGDTAGAAVLTPTALSPAQCEGDESGAVGESLLIQVRRRFAFAAPAVLRADLHTARPGRSDSVTDAHSLLSGQAGSLLSLRRFCASPRNGEPEWIEIRNVSTVAVSLEKVRLEGRALSASTVLKPGESLTAVAAADTAELRLWQPGARGFPLSSWPGLRNTGDTLRLAFEAAARGGAAAVLVLDSVIYGPGASPREACASIPTEESGAGAHGFGLETPPGRWRRRAGAWTLTVAAPDTTRSAPYDLTVHDLDGAELCALARNVRGPRAFPLSAATCARLQPSATALLLQLRPRGAPSVRRLVWVVP